jgi:hypothetical protein
MDALQMLENLENINVKAIAIETVADNTEEIAALNVDQLRHGLNSAGNLIGDIRPYKSAEYAFEKNQMNPEPGLGNPDLIKTGSFTSKIYAEAQGDKFIIDSTDEKTAKLEKKYNVGQNDGDELRGRILGLDDESKETLVDEYLRPDFQQKYSEQSGLKFQ